MSSIYPRVVVALQAAAERQEQVRNAPRDNQGYHQYIVLNPSDWADIANELGHNSSLRVLDAPGTWLLGVDIALDEDAHVGLVMLRTEEHY